MTNRASLRSPAEVQKRVFIFDKAEPLFERFGYRKTTVEDVCREAGISKRTFYEQFKNKADLFGHMLMNITETGMLEWAETLSDDDTAVEQLLSFLKLYVDLVHGRPVGRLVFSESLMNELADIMPELHDTPVLQIIERLIERGKRRGEFASDVDSKTAVWLIDAVLDRTYYIMPEMMKMPGADDDPAIAAEVRRFILAGLGVRRT
jgi:TetR/AcrR family transcriptional regulator, cholesterol catabolism regulator